MIYIARGRRDAYLCPTPVVSVSHGFRRSQLSTGISPRNLECILPWCIFEKLSVRVECESPRKTSSLLFSTAFHSLLFFEKLAAVIARNTNEDLRVLSLLSDSSPVVSVSTGYSARKPEIPPDATPRCSQYRRNHIF